MEDKLAKRDSSSIPARVDELLELGRVLVKSNLLPASFKTPEAVVAALLVCRDLGLGPSALLAGDVYVVNGRVALTTRRMLAMIYASGKVDVEIKYDHDRDAAVVTMKRRDGSASYTAVWDDARVSSTRANIDPRGGKEKIVWTRYRWLMKIHRAVSEAAQFVCPDIIGQAYVSDELDITTHDVYNPIDDVDIDVVDGSVVDETETTAAATRWVDSPARRKKFWAWACLELSLSRDQVLEALGVENLLDYDGSAEDAKNAIERYIRENVAEEVRDAETEEVADQEAS